MIRVFIVYSCVSTCFCFFQGWLVVVLVVVELLLLQLLLLQLLLLLLLVNLVLLLPAAAAGCLRLKAKDCRRVLLRSFVVCVSVYRGRGTAFAAEALVSTSHQLCYRSPEPNRRERLVDCFGACTYVFSAVFQLHSPNRHGAMCV